MLRASVVLKTSWTPPLRILSTSPAGPLGPLLTQGDGHASSSSFFAVRASRYRRSARCARVALKSPPCRPTFHRLFAISVRSAFDEQDPDDRRGLQPAPRGAESALKIDRSPGDHPAIAEARTHGDLAENAEYHAARERQSFIEGRVAELEDKKSPERRSSTPRNCRVRSSNFAATVTLADEETEEEQTFRIVGEDEADIRNGRLSVTSPLARALIGKGEGDSVEVSTPRGNKSYEIVTMSFSQSRLRPRASGARPARHADKARARLGPRQTSPAPICLLSRPGLPKPGSWPRCASVIR